MKFLAHKNKYGINSIYAGENELNKENAYSEAQYHLSESGIQMTNVDGAWQYINIPADIFEEIREKLAEFILNK